MRIHAVLKLENRMKKHHVEAEECQDAILFTKVHEEHLSFECKGN